MGTQEATIVDNSEVASTDEIDISEYVSMLSEEDLNSLEKGEAIKQTEKDDSADVNVVDEEVLDASKKEEVEDEKKEEPAPSSKNKFVFDKKLYEDQGITDTKVLSILEERDKQIFHGQKQIGTQGKDIGDLRRAIVELKAKKVSKDDINEMSLVDYEQATESVLMNNAIDKEIENTHMQIMKATNQNVVNDRCDNFESKIDDIADILIADGISKDIVNAFKNDPYSTDAPMLINLFKRAEQKSSITDIEKSYKDKISSLEKEIKSLKENAQIVTNGIRSMGKRSIDDVPSTSSPELKKVNNLDIALMSDEQLSKL